MGEVSGVYDLLTREAVRQFQRESGLPPSGTATPETLRCLGLPAALDALAAYEERRLVAAAVDALCPDGPYLVKVALAGVIFRRVSSESFPDSAAAVLFGETAFAGVKEHDFREEPSEEALRAARDAALGLSPCPDALYFYKIGTTDRFLLRLPVKYKSGDFVFA